MTHPANIDYIAESRRAADDAGQRVNAMWAGVDAGRARQPLESCPFGADDPIRRDGWIYGREIGLNPPPMTRQCPKSAPVMGDLLRGLE